MLLPRRGLVDIHYKGEAWVLYHTCSVWANHIQCELYTACGLNSKASVVQMKGSPSLVCMYYGLIDWWPVVLANCIDNLQFHIVDVGRVVDMWAVWAQLPHCLPRLPFHWPSVHVCVLHKSTKSSHSLVHWLCRHVSGKPSYWMVLCFPACQKWQTGFESLETRLLHGFSVVLSCRNNKIIRMFVTSNTGMENRR